MLQVAELRKSYSGTEVVRGVSFAVAAGECYGLLGPNGAGKTTTLRCCLGLTASDGGHISLAGLPVPAAARAARARTGVCPQFDNLDPDFTVAENLVVYGRYFGIPRDLMRERVPRLLEFAGLEDKAAARLDALSGGMKRRLTLARALVNDPQIIFLDEPTTGLDPQARHLIWDRLKSLTASGRTLILTTHFMDEAERLCHRVAIMDRGAMIAEDAPRRLIGAQIEPHVVEIYGEGVREFARDTAPRYAQRVELTGETAFCYCRDAAPLLESLQAHSALRALSRAANLEDVFIKLTGRDIRD
ncbi:MAG: ATP-binding cassette domain-containing protein [Gammaproteobacteria bacterium]|nr:ATP-binding cassette domain-containing protein [Gammaproteobacteria bacterium]MDE2250209.1 ATP-binding cassette domain-containing protein [Gammaproteobacteria bacterium]